VVAVVAVVAAVQKGFRCREKYRHKLSPEAVAAVPGQVKHKARAGVVEALQVVIHALVGLRAVIAHKLPVVVGAVEVV
jgi:hypothetical protein